jgi:peptide subunit release factor 1 (eRF1)
LKIYRFKCLACGYDSRHPVGTPGMNQILTDVNNEFAQYRLFVCRKELILVHADILDAQFDNKCPSDKSELEPIDDPEHAKCPRCDKELKVEDIKPLATADGSAE